MVPGVLFSAWAPFTLTLTLTSSSSSHTLHSLSLLHLHLHRTSDRTTCRSCAAAQTLHRQPRPLRSHRATNPKHRLPPFLLQLRVTIEEEPLVLLRLTTTHLCYSLFFLINLMQRVDSEFGGV